MERFWDRFFLKNVFFQMEAGRNSLPNGLGPGQHWGCRSQQNRILSKCLQSVLTLRSLPIFKNVHTFSCICHALKTTSYADFFTNMLREVLSQNWMRTLSHPACSIQTRYSTFLLKSQIKSGWSAKSSICWCILIQLGIELSWIVQHCNLSVL